MACQNKYLPLCTVAVLSVGSACVCARVRVCVCVCVYVCQSKLVILSALLTDLHSHSLPRYHISIIQVTAFKLTSVRFTKSLPHK